MVNNTETQTIIDASFSLSICWISIGTATASLFEPKFSFASLILSVIFFALGIILWITRKSRKWQTIRPSNIENLKVLILNYTFFTIFWPFSWWITGKATIYLFVHFLGAILILAISLWLIQKSNSETKRKNTETSDEQNK